MSKKHYSEQQSIATQKSREQIAAQIARISTKLQPRALLTGPELQDTDINSDPLVDGLNITTGFAGYIIALAQSGRPTYSLGLLGSTSEVRLAANQEDKLPKDGLIAERPRITAYPNGDLYAHTSISIIEDGRLTAESTDLTNSEIITNAANILGQIRSAVADIETRAKQVQ